MFNFGKKPISIGYFQPKNSKEIARLLKQQYEAKQGKPGSTLFFQFVTPRKDRWVQQEVLKLYSILGNTNIEILDFPHGEKTIFKFHTPVDEIYPVDLTIEQLADEMFKLCQHLKGKVEYPLYIENLDENTTRLDVRIR